MIPWTPGDLAKYMCLRCGAMWGNKPGPTICIKCRNDYVMWLNWPDNCHINPEDIKLDEK